MLALHAILFSQSFHYTNYSRFKMPLDTLYNIYLIHELCSAHESHVIYFI